MATSISINSTELEHPLSDISLSARPSDADDFTSGDGDAPLNAVDAIPDGGYGWTIAIACAVTNFMVNGWTGSWGVMQAALIQKYPQHLNTTTLSFVASLASGLCLALGLLCVRMFRLIGARNSLVLGVLLQGAGALLSSLTVDNVGGLLATAGAAYGLGSCLAYTAGTVLPTQWFTGRLGTANGIVKAGGGLGATVMAIVVQQLISRLGIAWAMRIMGFISIGSGIPAALLIKERSTAALPLIDLSLFKNLTFSCLFLAGAIGTFAIYVPGLFLPLFAHSIGLSASTGAGILAAFNACTIVGRFGVGLACDKLGSSNMLLLTMALNAISMLAIWPVSDTIGPLVLFAAVNGIANGAFFVATPTAISRFTGSGQSAVAVSMAVTGWSFGGFFGSPIAGILISSTGADSSNSIEPYRAAIFYAGGVALLSTAFVLLARLRMDRKLIKKL